jgi:hypothetical protein
LSWGPTPFSTALRSTLAPLSGSRSIDLLQIAIVLCVGGAGILAFVLVRRGSERERRGAATAELWASDLGHGYVDVNADYRS